jgi:hypothetical protein
MEEAKDYKKYLKALKEATKKSGKRKKNNKRPEIGIQGMLVARPFLKKLGGSMSKTDKKKFNPRTGEETNKPRGKDPRTIYKPENMKPKPITKKMGGLTGGQKKLDKNNNNRIDAQDFKILKAEKAKGRGMGLQDEKVKPGKVMKASKGGGADMGTKMSDKRKRRFKEILERLKSPTTINIKSEYKPGTRSPMQRDRKREGYRAKVESKGGKVLFMDEMKKGGSVMARGCKLGRKKATKLY